MQHNKIKQNPVTIFSDNGLNRSCYDHLCLKTFMVVMVSSSDNDNVRAGPYFHFVCPTCQRSQSIDNFLRQLLSVPLKVLSLLFMFVFHSWEDIMKLMLENGNVVIVLGFRTPQLLL